MEFTFGIITTPGKELFVNAIIKSIESLNIDSYEIIVVGSEKKESFNKTTYIPFDESIKESWITRKKNIITENANYENIVYLHDYIVLCEDWYSGFLNFGNDFDICMTKILNLDNTRYRDWCLWRDDAKKYVKENNYLIPYKIKSLSKMMYISGCYWVAKKHIMEKFPLNEKLSWGQGEDVEWSIRVRNFFNFSINEKSSVMLLKYKDRIFSETEEIENKILYNIKNYSDEFAYEKLIKNHIGRWL
jgi:hypothetical protein